MKTYEEKYNGLFNRLKAMVDAQPEVTKAAIKSLFPELKESEDEKTKRILHSISNKMSHHLLDIFTEEEFQCFDAWSNAWLEKQVEQKQKNAQKTNIEWWFDPITGDMHFDNMTLKQAEELKNALFGEQKPVEPQQDMLSQEQYAKAVDECIYGKQKPVEWSEEMGSLCLEAASLLSDYAEGVDVDSQLGRKISRARAFLVDLYHEEFYPSTYNPRPDLMPVKSAEWSEEDCNRISSIKYLLNELDNYNFDNWLDSLKDRYTCKPSEE